MEMNIKDIRKKLNYTQKQFANYFGIPTRTYQHWEDGDRQPPEYVLKLIVENLQLKGLLND